MRYSMLKTATLGLLGLSNVFLGVTAAPTAVVNVQERSDKLIARTVPVPDLAAAPYNYKPNPGPGLPSRPVTYNVQKTGFSGNIDTIKIDKAANTIIVEDANNGEDKGPNRLSMGEIALSLFVHQAGKTVAQLAIVRFEPTVEKSIQPYLKEAFAKLKPVQNIITVSASSTGEAKTIFNDINNNAAFGKSLAKLHATYGIGAVSKYEITGTAARPVLDAFV